MGEVGLYGKYDIPEGSFLLKPENDEAARLALRAYAWHTSNNALKVDIVAWLDTLDWEHPL